MRLLDAGSRVTSRKIRLRSSSKAEGLPLAFFCIFFYGVRPVGGGFFSEKRPG